MNLSIATASDAVKLLSEAGIHLTAQQQADLAVKGPQFDARRTWDAAPKNQQKAAELLQQRVPALESVKIPMGIQFASGTAFVNEIPLKALEIVGEIQGALNSASASTGDDEYDDCCGNC